MSSEREFFDLLFMYVDRMDFQEFLEFLLVDGFDLELPEEHEQEQT